jgi:hypothetical protein
VYVEITDGGSSSGAWSDGTLTLIPQATAAPEAAKVTRLHAPVPNPFNPSTLLTLELAQHHDHLVWNVYDIRGALVRRLDAGHMHAGIHRREWDGRDDGRQEVASGVYFGVVMGEGLRLSQKLVLMK